MTFEEKLQEKTDQAGEIISLTDLPETFEAKVLGDPIFKVDARGQECAYMTLVLKDKKTLPSAKTVDQKVIQKYTKTNYPNLNDAIIQAGGLGKLQTEFYTWKKQKVGRSINPRYFPEPKKRNR